MALAVTTLNGAVAQGARQITLTAFTNPAVGPIGAAPLALVDGEIMRITDAQLSPTVQVVRGYQGTLGVPHNSLAPVVYGNPSDFVNLALQGAAAIAAAPVASYSVNGAFTIPLVDQTVYITKAGVLALTLAAPAADSTVTVRFVSLTANAHTITYTAGFYGNTTSSDVVTFPGTVGAVFTMQAKNGLWVPVATADDGALIG